jgi:photosystem II PsbU protein
MHQVYSWLKRISLFIVCCLGGLYVGFFSWSEFALAKSMPLQGITVAEVQPCLESAQKIDLNNANLAAFTDCPGFYPTLAKLIVQQGPYKNAEEVLKIPDLSQQQQQLIKMNLNHFTVTDPIVPLAQRMPPRPMMR